MEPSELLPKFLRVLRSRDLWFDFDSGNIITDADLRLMLQEGSIELSNISSEPDIFPVYGDLDSAVDVHLPALVAYVQSIRGSRAATVSSKTGRLILHPEIRGFHNPTMTSCFMDSAMVAMFGLRGSPFYTNLIEKDYEYNPTTLLCDNDPDRDHAIRLRIQGYLREDVRQMLAGKARYACTRLRSELGDVCRHADAQGKKVGENLAIGIHDPSEMYSRLLDALDYMPMEYSTYSEVQAGGRWVRATNVHLRSTSVIPLSASDVVLQRIRWPGTFDGYIGESEPRAVDSDVLAEYTMKGEIGLAMELERIFRGTFLRRERMAFRRADAVVVSLDRRDYKKGGRETAVNERNIPVDQEMSITFEDGTRKQFYLQAVVYPPNPGHYHCLLKSGERWFDYNDLATNQTIQMQEMKAVEAKRRIDTKGVLFFYF
jgi:hypothetical protein